MDEIDASGKVTSRVETPFQKEEASAARAKLAALDADQQTSERAHSAEVADAVSAETDEIANTAIDAALEDEVSAPLRRVTIQPGATLWALAAERYGDGERYLQIFNANREIIRNPDLIYPGQIFDIPE